MKESLLYKQSFLKKPFLPVLLFFICAFTNLFAQPNTIKGRIEDAETGEGLIGASVLIEGTTKGTLADLEGNFVLQDIKNGTYNLVISYVSYEQQVHQIVLKKGEELEISFKLKPVSVELGAVKVTANKRADTEMALMSYIKVSSLVANGISKQQISRSQDKDASEVISRVPGVIVRDGKFINVRGLDERYNVVWLNGIGAPSSEADKRAFSFDMLPSSLIDNIVLYKTPAPELPADFAGAVVQIQTKSTVDDNSTDISYNIGYRSHTTFKDFYTYEGGKTDWLGFDDGTRSLPSSFPSTSAFKDLTDNPSEADKDKITALGRSFGKTWNPSAPVKAAPDQSLLITLNRKMHIKNLSVGNTTSIGYSLGNQFRDAFRAAYQQYDEVKDRPDTSYYFNDHIYASKVKLSGLFNWLFIFGNNQKIEFRNFFNQLSNKQTILRTGRDFYGGSYKSASELMFQSRTIYSGQLNGVHGFNNSRTLFNWTLGYGYTNNLQPDTRRIEKSRNEDSGPSAPYTTSLNFNADPKLLGRLTLNNFEDIYTGVINFSHKIELSGFTPEFKTGIYVEYKSRSMIARNIGFAISNVMNFDWNLMYQPIDSLFQDRHINFSDGIKVDESTNLEDSYDATNNLYAAYLGVSLPFQKLKVYTGVRVEKNRQYIKNKVPEEVENDYIDFFPSVNLTYNLTSKSLIRAAYGRTVNRPEFREIAPSAYYNFEEKATIYGNPDLKNSYIQNVELRYEFFPSSSDMITFGGFLKYFNSPIEAHLLVGQSGYNYKLNNAISARSLGLEVDVRKSFTNLAGSNGILSILRDFVVVFNAAVINSNLKTDYVNAREKERQMQGQSPYILNAGLFYDNAKSGLMISALYNVIGERIAYVGNNEDAHIYQMPRNLLDFTINKKIGKYLTLKAGIKDIFNQPVELRQNEFIQVVPNDPDSKEKRIQKTQIYKPSSSFTVGFSMNF
jgi:outer membrane receptor for ferrienterochelin and colicin